MITMDTKGTVTKDTKVTKDTWQADEWRLG
jgi:hypothetical protein